MTVSEAKRALTEVLFWLHAHCDTLTTQSTDTLRRLVHITIEHLRREIIHPLSDLKDTIQWLEMSFLTLHPVVVPVPLPSPGSTLPRADPSILLRALNQWFIPPNCWRKFTHRAQITILRGVGTGLKACHQILQKKNEYSLSEGIVSSVSQSLDRILDHTDHIFIVS
jgi:hypothetical protein